MPPADPDEVHKLFVEDLGEDPATLFAKWDDQPFASASIAQVHYATLHSGEEVVVKIQRPGIRRRVAADLQILKRGAQVVELAKLGRRLSAQDVVADFADNLAEELDFRLEAQSMDAWVAHMHASPLGKNIRVPQVYWDHTSERVLTMERVQRHSHRRRSRDPQGRVRRDRAGQGVAVQRVRGRPAARALSR